MSQPLKIRLYRSASSNVTYSCEEVIDCDYSQEEWDKMTGAERDDYLNQLAEDFVWEDISCSANIVE